MNEFYKLLKALRLLRGDDDSPLGGVISASFIGIIVAISGNVLISLALNCQKLAHKQLAEQKAGKRNRERLVSPHRRNSRLSRELLLEDSDEEREGGDHSNNQDGNDGQVLSPMGDNDDSALHICSHYHSLRRF